MLLRIVAPHFVAGLDTDNGVYAPIISYMKGWELDRVYAYCRRKGWTVEMEVTIPSVVELGPESMAKWTVRMMRHGTTGGR